MISALARKPGLLIWPIIIAGSLLLSRTAISRAGADAGHYGNDFTVFYAAAEHLLKQGDPYHHAIAAQTPYLYPPLFAFLLLPLALLPLPIAATCWYWFNIVSTILLILIITRLVVDQRHQRTIFGSLLALLLAHIIIDNLLWGQVNILVALLIAGWLALTVSTARTDQVSETTTAPETALSSQKFRQWLAVIMLAVAISIKITPALLAVYLLAKRRTREFIRLLICLILINGISLIPLGRSAPALLIYWFKRTILNGEGFNWAYAGNQSLRGALTRLLTSSNTESHYWPQSNLITLDQQIATLIILLIIVSLLGYFCYYLSARQPALISEVAGVAALMLLLSNLSWKTHFIFMAFPWAVLLKVALSRAPARTITRLLLVFSLIICNLTGAALIGARAQEWVDVYSGYCLTALMGFFAVVLTTSNSSLNKQLDKA